MIVGMKSEEITSESEEEIQVLQDKSLSRSSVTYSEAYDCITRALEWLEEQSEATVYNTGILRCLKKLSASKRDDVLKQKTIIDFFNWSFCTFLN